MRLKSGEIDWALVDAPFAEPFFEQSAEIAMRHPFNLAFGRRTPLASLDALHAHVPGMAPVGFVFHMSRCGSTLVAQMLARLSATIVLSEPQPLDALLRLRGCGVDDDTLIRWFRTMVSALAERRDGEHPLFVKLYAWHVLELPFIARTYPNVPWIFVFREPREVLRSQVRSLGPEAVVGTIAPEYLGLDYAAGCAMPPAEYAARAVGAFCEAALRYPGSGRSAFLDYATLPDAVFSELLPFFGVDAGDADRARMRDAALLDSKESSTGLRARADDADSAAEIERLAAAWLDAPYAALRGRTER
ncbi:MAG TPA: hypothetical protein VIW69_09905 [Candidatus Elarobacter sp.]